MTELEYLESTNAALLEAVVAYEDLLHLMMKEYVHIPLSAGPVVRPAFVDATRKGIKAQTMCRWFYKEMALGGRTVNGDKYCKDEVCSG